MSTEQYLQWAGRLEGPHLYGSPGYHRAVRKVVTELRTAATTPTQERWAAELEADAQYYKGSKLAEIHLGICAYLRNSVPIEVAQKLADEKFLSGVFSAMQYLVVTRREPSLAAELAKEHGIKLEWALAESKRNGAFVCEMNKFIREELKPVTAYRQ